ncbi:FAD-dependent oxidoreductase [bacterium]|nr:FAD-dependent oxidoreductase [bacterium]
MKIVIIGAVAAGSKCAAKLKRDNPNFEIEIYTEDDHISYSACGMPYFIEGMVKYEDLIARTPEEFEKNGIKVFLKHKVTEIIRREKKIRVTNKDNHLVVKYDKLVIATGATPITPPIKNVKAKNVFSLRTLEDAKNIREIMLTSKTATIVGGGYIGIELMEAFVKNGLKVNLIEFSPQILPVFDFEIAELIKAHILKKEKENVNIITSDGVVEFVLENGIAKKILTQKGNELESDFVVICAGVRPNSELARASGLELGIKNTIKVNSLMQTSDSDIYAVGDCAEKTNVITQKPAWIPMGSTANKEGRTAALTLSGKKEPFEGILGSAVTRYFDFTVAMTGLTQKEAEKNCQNIITATVTKEDIVSFMPNAKSITVKIVACKDNGKILGAQAIGCGDAIQRINSIAALLQTKGTVFDLLNLDLPYAPPYSPTIDPLLSAAQIIFNKANK